MTHAKKHAETEAEDNISISVYNAEDVASLEDASDADPKAEMTTHNTTRSVYHQEIIDALANSTDLDIKIDSFALGDSTTDTASLGDTQVLGNELFRTSTVDLDANGQTLDARVFIDAVEANGVNLNEAALISERQSNEVGINRFLLDDPGGLLDPKSRNETVTVTINLTQSDA
jgi:hypothetical protein